MIIYTRRSEDVSDWTRTINTNVRSAFILLKLRDPCIIKPHLPYSHSTSNDLLTRSGKLTHICFLYVPSYKGKMQNPLPPQQISMICDRSVYDRSYRFGLSLQYMRNFFYATFPDTRVCVTGTVWAVIISFTYTVQTKNF